MEEKIPPQASRDERPMSRRVEYLEEEFVRQSQNIEELRGCSLRTERSLQRLLSGLDRFMKLVSGEPGHVHAAHPGAEPRSAEPCPAEPHLFEQR